MWLPQTLPRLLRALTYCTYTASQPSAHSALHGGSGVQLSSQEAESPEGAFSSSSAPQRSVQFLAQSWSPVHAG